MIDYRLEIHQDKEILIKNKERHVFKEGPQSKQAEKRYQKIENALQGDFLPNLIRRMENSKVHLKGELEEEKRATIDKLVNSITPQEGRALAGLTVLQLCIKSIAPNQSVRLHKKIWVEGISMRSLDSKFVTPVLRKHKLLMVNKDGVFMTRTLSENYPYTKLYKPKIRGAKEQWIEIVEWLESDELDPKLGLQYLISELIKRRDKQEDLEKRTLSRMKKYLKKYGSEGRRIKFLIRKHITQSQGAARLLEVGVHSLYQVMEDLSILEGGKLKPLSQMRSADKKAGEVGDIEICVQWDEDRIKEAFDPKYNKNYFLKELDELEDKLAKHPEVERVEFITTLEPRLDERIKQKIEAIKSDFNTTVAITRFEDFVEKRLQRINKFANDGEANWFRAYIESLAQRRRERTPIDEPCVGWLEKLLELLPRDSQTSES